MGTTIRPSRAVFAAVLIGLGIAGFIYGNAAEIWDPIPKGLPGRALLIYLCSLIELVTGIGLLMERSVTIASRILLPFLLLWMGLLRLTVVFKSPGIMVSWESLGELLIFSAGAWCLFAAHAGKWEQEHLKFAIGEDGIAIARLLLILALPMIGLSHFVYHDLTASLVPKWMHFSLGWTYFTGAASLATAAALLLGICPRLAVNLEALMVWLITLLVWVPRIASHPTDQGTWIEFLISCAIAAGVWLVADTYRSVPWLGSGKPSRAVSLDPDGPAAFHHPQPV